MPVQTARFGETFASVLRTVKARLVAVLTLPTTPPIPVTDRFVRVVVTKGLSPASAEFRAERGLTVRVGPLEPAADCGAGRSGWLVGRTLEVWVVTQCLLDQAGDDLEAIARHAAFEEAVVDAVVDSVPAGRPNCLPAGVRVTWEPGGSPMARINDTDQGVVQSSVRFRCEYPFVFKINRD